MTDKIRDEKSFIALMERVDGKLRARGIPIPARPIHAESELAQELEEHFEHPYPKRTPRAGCYTGHDLTIRVNDWFARRYGDRLKINFSPGSIVLMIAADPWLVEYPALFGTWHLICSATETSSPPGPHISRGEQPRPRLRYNIVESIAHLPPAVIAGLSPTDCQLLVERWRDGLAAWKQINDALPAHELVRFAVADLQIAVQQISTRTGSPNLAKWAAQQAVEKMLKCYLTLRSTPFHYTHDLDALTAQAERGGLNAIGRPWLNLVKCPPGARYGEVKIPIEEAVNAQQAGIGISSHIARQLRLSPGSDSRSD